MSVDVIFCTQLDQDLKSPDQSSVAAYPVRRKRRLLDIHQCEFALKVMESPVGNSY